MSLRTLGRWIGMSLCVATVAVASAQQPVGAETTTRLIVKFRDAAPVTAETTTMATAVSAGRIARLAADAGIGLTHERAMAVGAHVLRLDQPLPLAEAQALAARLAANPDVEYAQPSRRRYAMRIPNDAFVGQQTYLDNGPTYISAYAAWDLTTGSPNTVVAVVDTGYRPHADIAGRILPGYDFITDPKVANDGDGRDADATDPGDWVTPADLSDPTFKDCTVENSSWHGTGVAGIIAANSNNGQGVAGIDWAAKILPVRVLGKCFGDDPDILDGIAWAAGLAVPGAPANPYPAQIINLSLGGPGPCEPAYQSVIDSAFAHGVTRAIIVAAGNDSVNVSTIAPANCSGVIAVAATSIQGNLASYSAFGTGIALSAPGGASSRDHILLLSNAGMTSPGTDTLAAEQGTSFAAPMVSGVASLVLGIAPNLSVSQLRSLLTATASPFVPVSDCTTLLCGAGIVNAYAAVVAAQPPPATTPDLNQHGLTGAWYEPATGGQGFLVEMFPDLYSPGTGLAQLSWFSFDTVVGGAERQRWYTLSGTVRTGQPNASLTIYQNTGGNFNAPPVTLPNPPGGIGTATLSFDSCAAGHLSYSFTDGSGRSGTIPLTRLIPNVTCSMTAARPTNADFAHSGNWYDKPTSGQGFTVEMNPNAGTLFFAWYTYAPNGESAGAAGQRWYTGQSTYVAGARSIAVEISETTGGLFDAPSTPAPHSSVVGTGTLAFQSCSGATLNYNFTGGSSSGKSGTITLGRVGPVPPGCS